MALAVEGVVRIVGPDDGHHARGDEGGHVVDVPVGLLRVDALLDPDDLFHAQVRLQVLVHVGAQLLAPGLELLGVGGPDGVLVGLLGEHGGRGAARGEQALVGDDHGALAVHRDGAALEDHVVGTVARAARELGHLRGDLVVGVPREVQAVDEAAVGVEVPVDRALAARPVGHEGGAGVTEPGVVGGHLDDGHVVVVLEGGQAIGEVGLVGAHGDRRELRDGPRDGGVLLLGRLGAVGPGVGAVRPAHPHAVLRGELGRHGEPVGGRGGVGLVDGLHRGSFRSKSARKSSQTCRRRRRGWPRSARDRPARADRAHRRPRRPGAQRPSRA